VKVGKMRRKNRVETIEQQMSNGE